MSATIWRTWTFRASAIPLALIGLIGAAHGPRYDVIVAPSGDLAAVRDADGALRIVGKRFNAFAAEQWLSADGDGARPGERARSRRALRSARLRRRSAGRGVAQHRHRPHGVRRGLRTGGSDRERAQRACGLQGEIRARRKGAGAHGRCRPFLDRRRGICDWRATAASLQDRPWSPAPRAPRDARLARPGRATSHGADPADPSIEPGEGR